MKKLLLILCSVAMANSFQIFAFNLAEFTRAGTDLLRQITRGEPPAVLIPAYSQYIMNFPSEIEPNLNNLRQQLDNLKRVPQAQKIIAIKQLLIATQPVNRKVQELVTNLAGIFEAIRPVLRSIDPNAERVSKGIDSATQILSLMNEIINSTQEHLR